MIKRIVLGVIAALLVLAFLAEAALADDASERPLKQVYMAYQFLKLCEADKHQIDAEVWKAGEKAIERISKKVSEDRQKAVWRLAADETQRVFEKPPEGVSKTELCEMLIVEARKKSGVGNETSASTPIPSPIGDLPPNLR